MGSEKSSQPSVRLEARVSPRVKEALQLAAELQGRSLTDFLASAAWEAAIRVIEAHRVLRLDREESEIFANALLEPVEPNETLRSAARRYGDLGAPG